VAVDLTITQLILSWNDRTTHCDLLAVHAFQEQEEVQAASLLLCVCLDCPAASALKRFDLLGTLLGISTSAL